MPRSVTLITIGLVTLALGYEFYTVLAPFLFPLFLAAVLAMLVEPLHRRFQARFPKRASLAAGLTTATVVVLLLLPFALGTLLAAGQMIKLATSVANDPKWGERLAKAQEQPWVREAINTARDALGMEVPEGNAHDVELRETVKQRTRDAGLWLAQRTLGAAGSTVAIASSLANLSLAAFTFLLAFYYFLADGPALYDGAKRLLPVDGGHMDQLVNQFETAVRGVVLATVAAAAGQGVATAAAMWVCGFSGFFLFAILGTLSALVPVMGTWLIWGPAAVWLYLSGHTLAAVLLALWGVLIVGGLDNVIRAYVLNSSVELHPVLAFVSVLGGLQALGLWGVFIGPVIASCLYAAAQIFNQELAAYAKGVVVESSSPKSSAEEKVGTVATGPIGAEPQAAPAK
jgi:predicted PurR-regulated permease PerM